MSESSSLLLVEDNPADARLMQEMLRDASPGEFNVTVANRLAAALGRLDTEHFDVILSDLSLPDSRDLETFRSLVRRAGSTPIVVLTGLDDAALAVTAVQEGAQDYLVKGQVRGDSLARALRYAIERQQLSRYRASALERQFFDRAIAQMSDGIVIADDQNRIIAANHAACILLNLDEHHVKGVSLDQAMSAFELTKTSSQLSDQFDLARPDSKPPLYLDARLTRLLNPQGQVQHLVLSVRDVTSQRQAMRVRSDFFTLVSHKLRTPLCVLAGYVQLLQRLTPPQQAQATPAVLPAMQAEVGRLSGVIEDLLQFKAVDQMQIEPAEEFAALAALIADVGNEIAVRHAPKSIVVTPALAAGAETVAASPEHVRLILAKLMDNAAKFTAADPVRIDIAAQARENGDWVEINIKDNGPGVPHEYFDRLLGGFVQIEPQATGNVPGLGAGLFLARKIIEAYAGRIWLQSTLGQGLTVCFTLPAA